MKSPSVLLVEDSQLFQHALTNVLWRNGRLRVTPCTSNSFQTRLLRLQGDVAVIDAVTWMSGQPALVQTVEELSAARPVLLLGREDCLESYLEPLLAGAMGFVKQTAPEKTLVKAVKSVVRGEIWFDRKLFTKILRTSKALQSDQTARLNAREQAVLRLLVRGRTNKEIASTLGLTERNAKAYVSSLMKKTGVSTRTELAVHAVRCRLAGIAGI